MTLTDQELAELERLHGAATPGPWHLSDQPYEVNDYRNVIRSKDHSLIASVGNLGATSDYAPAAKRWKAESPANAAVIIAAHTALPALIAEVRRLRASRNDVVEECARVAEAETGKYPHGNMMYGPSVPPKIAAAIRAEKDKP